MRLGQNPAKSIDHIEQPHNITIAVVTYIPFLSGYYTESLEVLKACLGSIWENTNLPYDLLVFDNASCPEVRSFLVNARDQGRIQFLVLSDKNIGKPAAWNFIFGAAPGEFIAYADSDVYFYPGWLPAQIALFDLFPKLGMVTGAPLRVPEEFSTSTVQWAEKDPDARLARGRLISWEDYWRHARSLGVPDEEEGRRLYEANQDVAIEYRGKQYLIGAAHYQFVARSQVLKKILPIPANRPMGQVRALDIAINEMGYLRLTTPEWWVQHLGNHLETTQKEKGLRESADRKPQKRFLHTPIIRRSLLRLYDGIFRIYFNER